MNLEPVNVYRIFNIIIECGIIFLIVFTPLAFGTVHVWAYTVMELVILFLLLVWLLKLIYVNRSFPRLLLSSVRTPLNLPLCLFFLLVLFQMVPLSPSVIEHISPNTHSLYIQTVPGYGIHDTGLNSSDKISPSRPLSIYSHATRDELLKFLAYAAVFFLIINNIKTRDQIRRLVLAIVITGTIVAFLGILQMLSGANKIYWFWLSKYKIGNYFGPYVNPNHFAGYMGMVTPLGIGLLIAQLLNRSFIPAGSWRHRLSVIESHLSKNSLLIFLIVIMGLSLFFSLSRGGILCFLFSMVFFFTILGIKRSQRKKRKIGAVILGLIFTMLIWIGIDPVLRELSTLADIRFISNTRTIISKDTLDIARDFPFFGVGLGNFQYVYPKYTTLKLQGVFTHAHNDYMEMLADAGWPGAILFFGGIVFLLIKTLMLWYRRKDPFVIGITLGGVTGAVFILLQSMVTFNFHIPANAMLFFIILGLTTVVVNPSIPTRTISLRSRMKLAVYPLMFILLAVLAVTVVSAYQGEKHFKLYKSSTGPMIPHTLIKSIACDPSHAACHYELGRYYARAMSKCCKEGKWEYVKGKWVFEPGKDAFSNGLMALDSYFQAVILQPANAWYHFNLGWIIEQLVRYYPEATAGPISRYPSIRPVDEFNLAIILAPGNSYIKKHVEKSKAESSKDAKEVN
ncbi:MAG: O-antigen ligase family protein [Deltaproteobacteria bacterium]|nr:O-antigen ligase family protein [Deltaproteobacteria bacterium]